MERVIAFLLVPLADYSGIIPRQRPPFKFSFSPYGGYRDNSSRVSADRVYSRLARSESRYTDATRIIDLRK